MCVCVCVCVCVNNLSRRLIVMYCSSKSTGPGIKTWWVRYTFYRVSDLLPS